MSDDFYNLVEANLRNVMNAKTEAAGNIAWSVCYRVCSMVEREDTEFCRAVEKITDAIEELL